jgi:hypothetical protein
VLLLGYTAVDLTRFVVSRAAIPAHVVRNTLLGLAFGALVFALPRTWLRLRESHGAWAAAERAHDDDRRFLARVEAGLAELDRTPLAARPDVRVVLYVGESSSRWDWSLYGYPRNTNEAIVRAVDSSRLVAFTRAEAPPPANGVRYAEGLSSLGFLYRREGDRVVPLVHTLARAGVTTTWLRVASKPWRYDAALTGGTLDSANAAHDGDLLPRLRAALAAPGASRLVVLDGWAGHFPWCDGVPDAQRIGWNDWLAGLRDVAIWGRGRPFRAALDCYDSAMRYASGTIAEAMRAVDAVPAPALLLYAPNRGEDAWSSAGPAARAQSPRVTDVPLLVYANDTFARRYPEALAAARHNRDARVATQWMYHAVIDAFGVATSAANVPFDPRLSVLDARFDPRADPTALASVHTPPGDSAELARGDASGQGGRLCAHRNDAVLKFLEGRAAYDCVEMDVMLDTSARGDGPAFIYHPPTPDPGLPLYDLLARSGIPAGGIWLDVKNLDARNAPAFIAHVSRLVPPPIRSRVLVETGNLALAGSPAARAVADSGFVLSYYIDTELGCECSRSSDPACERALARLADSLQLGGFGGLSFDARGRGVARVLRERIEPRPALNSWTPMDRCVRGEPPNPLAASARDTLLGEVGKYLVKLPSDFNY